MSNPLDALEVLHRRARNPDAPRGPYTAADALRLAIEMRKEANAAAAQTASKGLHKVLGGLGSALQGATWDLPQWIGGGIGEVGHHVLRGGAAAARKATYPLRALAGGAGTGQSYLQRGAGALEDLVTFPFSSGANFGNSLLMGFLGHEAVTNAQRMKAMGQVVKPRGPQGGAFKNIFEPMG